MATKGSTQGSIEAGLLADLQTAVINNAVAEATLKQTIEEQVACSAVPGCRWSVIMAGGSPSDAEQGTLMKQFVTREVAAGKNVIIHGHPNPNPEGAGPVWWSAMMDAYAEIAASNPKADFVDPRRSYSLWCSKAGCQPAKMDMRYYAADRSSPSLHGGQLISKSIGAIILSKLEAKKNATKRHER